MSVYEKIGAQQKGREHTDVFMAGQQLKDILRDDPSPEEIVDKDLDVAEMSLVHCAKQIRAWADEQHKQAKGSCVCVPPDVAEGIIRKFYGLPDAGAVAPVPEPVQVEDTPLDFGDFL